MIFTVIDDRTNEPVAAIRRYSETYATFLEGSERVFKLLEAKIPVTQTKLIEVLSEHGYRLEPGVPPWVDSQQWGRRFIPKFFCPEAKDWLSEYEISEPNE